MKYFLIGTFFIFLISCQQKPTKTYQRHKYPEIAMLVAGAQKPIVINENTVVLDARKPFHYSLYHIPGSINLSWQEFTQRENNFFRNDKETMARRLARLGISLSSPVVVVGQGRQGGGEEGRLALTLFHLGVRNIQIANINYFPKKVLTQTKSEAKKNAEYWKPLVESGMQISLKSFLNKIKNKNKSENAERKVIVLDVRSQKEYLSNSDIAPDHGLPDLGAINIPWQQFYDHQGRADLKMKSKLRGLRIYPQNEILVISENGLNSAAVTFALLNLGYADAKQFAGGWAELR